MAVYQYSAKRSSSSSSSKSLETLSIKDRSNSTDWLATMKQCGDNMSSEEFSTLYPDLIYCYEHKTVNQRVVQRMAVQSGGATPVYDVPSKINNPRESCDICVKSEHRELALNSRGMITENGGKDVIQYRDQWLGVRSTQDKQVTALEMVEWNIAESQAFIEYQKQAWDLGVVRRLLMIKKHSSSSADIITEEEDRRLSKYDETLREFHHHCGTRRVPCKVMCFEHTIETSDDGDDSISDSKYKIGDFVPMSMISRYRECGICNKARRPKQAANANSQREMPSDFMGPQNASTYYASIEAEAFKPRRGKAISRRS
jgi:hypothetical protein